MAKLEGYSKDAAMFEVGPDHVVWPRKPASHRAGSLRAGGRLLQVAFSGRRLGPKVKFKGHI